MYENQELNLETPLTRTKELLVGVLSVGIILAGTHGALFPDHQDLTPVDFTAKVIKDLHTHNDFQVQQNHILIDPKSLRSIRSEGDKTAEGDGLRGNWDVYQA